MAVIGTELNRSVQGLFIAADIAANQDFVAVNLGNIGGSVIYVDSIDLIVSADAADIANLINLQVELDRNLVLRTDVALAAQVPFGGQPVPMWRGRTKLPTERYFNKEFTNGGVRLTPDAFYSVFAFATLSAPLVGTMLLFLSVMGRYEDMQGSGQLYGKSR